MRTVFNFEYLWYQAQSCFIHACTSFDRLNITLHKIINKMPVCSTPKKDSLLYTVCVCEDWKKRRKRVRALMGWFVIPKNPACGLQGCTLHRAHLGALNTHTYTCIHTHSGIRCQLQGHSYSLSYHGNGKSQGFVPLRRGFVFVSQHQQLICNCSHILQTPSLLLIHPGLSSQLTLPCGP